MDCSLNKFRNEQVLSKTDKKIIAYENIINKDDHIIEITDVSTDTVKNMVKTGVSILEEENGLIKLNRSQVNTIDTCIKNIEIIDIDESNDENVVKNVKKEEKGNLKIEEFGNAIKDLAVQMFKALINPDKNN